MSSANELSRYVISSAEMILPLICQMSCQRSNYGTASLMRGRFPISDTNHTADSVTIYTLSANSQPQENTQQWRNTERNCASNQRHLGCLLSRLSRRRSKNTPKLSVTGLCEWNSLVTGEFSAQRASNEDNVSIWWRHHALRDVKHL